jgi:hypothetical protein
MTAGGDNVGSARVRPGNPFPGLRPFEPHESSLFFGRDEQCDDLLARLGRRRLVAVVGMSGSGKSSLVRAGLLPALARGYLPSAGSSWQIAIFRPGSDPIANLTRGLAARGLSGGGTADGNEDEIRPLLDATSLGLVAAARTLLQDSGDSLLIVADQFEELFRFGRIGKRDDARQRSAACVDLLLNASSQQEVPIYVVLTMRSDYLGDCAQFTGLPEALNDSQFLVPRMTRAQLREAIECPAAVGGAQITARLVQRLLHEIEDIPTASEESPGARQDQDQLPVLQHALMRMWEVSAAARERGEPIDLPHYEQPPVETLSHALDRHAEEVYQGLPTDAHRYVARLIFQQLTDRDAENREVRRPTPLPELTAVAVDAASRTEAPVDDGVVREVIGAFSGTGRAFVVINAQQDVDISHESFIRRWTRLHEWVLRESRSRRIYLKLADVAAAWQDGQASLYRGPELTEARRWWKQETPTQSWANRYDSRFDVARRFLAKSVRWRVLRRALVFGNVALLLVSAWTIAALMARGRAEAQRNEARAKLAEAEALDARNVADTAIRRLADAQKLLEEAYALQREGKSAQADALIRQAQQVQSTTNTSALTASEVSELARLRRQEATWARTEADLRGQLTAARATPPVAAAPIPEAGPPSKAGLAGSEREELEKLRSARSTWERETAQLKEQLAAANDRAKTAQQSESSLRKLNEDLQARLDKRDPGTVRPLDTADITQVLRDFEAAYGRRDVNTVVKLMPSANRAGLSKSFSDLNAYELNIRDAEISVQGDTAVVTCVREITTEPKVGARHPRRVIPSVIRLKRSAGTWTIEAVEEKR